MTNTIKLSKVKVRIPRIKFGKLEIKRKSVLRITIALTIVLLLMFVLTSGVYFYWSYFVKPQTKVISGINWYKQAIVLKVLDREIQLDKLDMYNISLETEGNIEISAYDTNSVLLETRTHELGRQAGYVLDIWSDQDLGKQCFVEADVTGLFYKESENAVEELGTLNYLSKEPVFSSVVESDIPYPYYLLPGSYSLDKMPESLSIGERLLGMYPVSCEGIDTPANLIAEIKQWAVYNSSEQRVLYDQKLAELLAN